VSLLSNCLQIGIVILLLATLEAAESVSTVTKATESTTVSTTTTGGSESTPETSTDPTQPSPTDQANSESGSLENGGYPFATPGKRGGARHVVAHDGFHSLLNEKKWAHWNDAFTTPIP
ncbi:hypothetical protein KR054_011972, partial [Drosophila jambulina]